ncbi:hypothetical protein DRW42_00165 [Pedobacter miscanthi]|uniref:Uncharacterized protein n=1 Tax=Pedobacter miscanthi TaxID=2259170 RepID=A0A366LCX6_9SPHI|nr:hypothetical protein DRW42_00165 [Pedobacter miscanthi]
MFSGIQGELNGGGFSFGHKSSSARCTGCEMFPLKLAVPFSMAEESIFHACCVFVRSVEFDFLPSSSGF